ncbi:6-phosphofructokinase [Alkalicoccus urumqiensis]|uniref:ATP-dependent 6-phosphofructokinase n=1 Tax=Alkalicoccus urumqiensis TaxID=1548213 RepID=A0A2P6MKT2_ALKUR|nr:6-phosphofructokinase [Alkalicoccus urumqiensis]PRO66897.1 6-phosphofructokinase [Alkalicoccus urumqiensis]
MKNIAVLTSGGDSPGMNAAIRAVVRSAVYYNMQVYGIQRGYEGLMHGDIKRLTASSVGDIIHKGGTILKTARSPRFMTEEGRNQAFYQLRRHQIDGLVVIGGDGSFRGAQTLQGSGTATIGIPGTIDNDLAYTDYTIGFDTAVNTVLEAVTKIRDTSSSHEKTTIIEVMGRNCGDLAVYAGVAGGAESIIIPENPVTYEDVIHKLDEGRARGREHHIIMLAEGAGSASNLQQQIVEETGEEARVTVLGFIQRGGDPTASDRLLASRMGLRAVEELRAGTSDHVIGIDRGELFAESINTALTAESKGNEELMRLSSILSV